MIVKQSIVHFFKLFITILFGLHSALLNSRYLSRTELNDKVKKSLFFKDYLQCQMCLIKIVIENRYAILCYRHYSSSEWFTLEHENIFLRQRHMAKVFVDFMRTMRNRLTTRTVVNENYKFRTIRKTWTRFTLKFLRIFQLFCLASGRHCHASIDVQF